LTPALKYKPPGNAPSKETNVRNDPQEGDRVVESRTGHAGTVVKWEQHDPSTVYVLFDYQRPSSEPKLRRVSELTVVSTMMRRSDHR
jgi:hypothetical protein